MLVILLLLSLSAVAGAVAFTAVGAWPNADPAMSATAAVEERLRRWRRVRRFLRSRLDPATATGLALTVVLVATVVTGAALGVVIEMIRTNSGVVWIDQKVARWAATHGSDLSFQAAQKLSWLGTTPVVILLACAGAIFAWRRKRGIGVPLFFALVLVGQFAASNLIKFAVGRVRPDLGPVGPLGTPSFPSGHSTAAAATFAALALVIGRDRSPRVRAALAGVAVVVAVAVAGSRVLIGVHWSSDVAAGLMLGWTWVAVCAIAFGGRLLWFGAPAIVASEPGTGARYGLSPAARSYAEPSRASGRSTSGR